MHPNRGRVGMLTVGVILRESVQATLRFVAWYLDQGADRIVMCFDDPDDPAIDRLSGHPNIDCIRCTPAFWEKLGIAPDARFTKRQNRAMKYVYRTRAKGWFLNVDCDEFVHLEGRSLAEEIVDQPDHIRAVRVLPAEHIQTPDRPGETHFRLPMRRCTMRTIYGDYAKAMQPRQGLMAHTMGKSLTRVGLRRVAMRQHWAMRPDGSAVTDRVLDHRDGAYLLHFADQGFDTWRQKLTWRLSSRGFRQPFRDILIPILEQADPEPDLRAVYEATHVFDDARLALLNNARAGLSVQICMDALTEAYFGARIAQAA